MFDLSAQRQIGGAVGNGVSCGFLREKIRLVDFTIWGTPTRSSKINKPLAKMAKAAIAPLVSSEIGAVNSRVNIPMMPNSWIPKPAGIIGTNANAVTRG